MSRTRNPAEVSSPSMAGPPFLRIGMMLESDEMGGAEVMTLRLSEELRRRGHEIHYVGPQAGSGWLRGRYEAEGFQTHGYPLRGPLDPNCLLAIGSLARRLRLDVLHSHEFAMAFYGALACVTGRASNIITLHGNPDTTAAWRRRAALRWAIRNSHATIPVSEFTRDDLARSLGRGYAKRLHVIRNGVPQPTGTRATVREELGIGHDEILVVAIGTQCRRKNHISLLRALVRSGTDWGWRLAIAGREDDATAELRAFVEGHDLGARVHLLGPRSDVGDLLAASDIFSMPSLWEGLPLALLEAMLMGKPVIASKVAGIPEAVTHGREGLLHDPGDVVGLSACLLRMRSDPHLRTECGRAALSRARQHYTVDAMAGHYEATYRAAISWRAGRSRLSGVTPAAAERH